MSPRKPLAPLLLVLALSGVACLPGPSDPIEYLHLEQSVIVQKVTVPASGTDDEVAQACRVPEITLYGDGTLLFREPEGDGFAPGLHQAQLDESQITDLLEAIDDREFFVFPYEIEGSVGRSPNATFLYVQTKEAANAVRVSGMREDAVDDSKAQATRSIAQRLNEIVSAAAQPREFEAEQALLVAKPFEGSSVGVPEWDGPVELSAFVDAGLSRREVEGPDALTLLETSTPGNVRVVSEDGRFYAVCARPLLPFEENFPEFDPS